MGTCEDLAAVLR